MLHQVPGRRKSQWLQHIGAKQVIHFQNPARLWEKRHAAADTAQPLCMPHA